MTGRSTTLRESGMNVILGSPRQEYLPADSEFASPRTHLASPRTHLASSRTHVASPKLADDPAELPQSSGRTEMASNRQMAFDQKGKLTDEY